MQRKRKPSQWFKPMGERSNIFQNQSSGLRMANFASSASAKYSASTVTFSGSRDS